VRGPARGERWRLFAHPAFSEPLDRLVTEVDALRRRDPSGYSSHPKTKLLRRVVDLITTETPRDPGAREYNLGNTLGPAYRHWRRAKFLGRFRLFFRYSSAHRSILYVWMNDEGTLTKAGDRNDPYALFERRLRSGNPPDSWDELMALAKPVGRPDP
jgi:toxin YhaV